VPPVRLATPPPAPGRLNLSVDFYISKPHDAETT
jgi:hypothetical protein